MWTAHQRYDYLVRIRRATPAELRAAEKIMTEHPLTARREVLCRAVHELTGRDPGATPDDWHTLLAELKPVPAPGSNAAPLDAKDGKQFLPVAASPPDDSALEEPTRIAKEFLIAAPERRSALLAKLRDGKGSAYSLALANAIGQLSGDMKKTVREALAERLQRLKSANLAAYMEDENPELRRAAALACALKEDKTLIGKLIDLLDDPESAVQRAAYAALKSLTNQDFGPAREAAPDERAEAVAAWRDWWKQQIGL
jgi:hypothetical protein